MKRWIKISAIALTAVAVLAGGAFATALQLGERKMHRRIAVDPPAVAAATDATSIERGRYLFMSRGCSECHGATGIGKDVVNEPGGLLIHAPNITPAHGGVVASYQPVDWVRSIRHGVKPNGEPILVMPSEDYNRLTDADLAALIGFVRQLPAADGPGATVRFPPMVKALYGLGVIPDAAQKIDHTLPPSKPIAEGVTPEHGAYVANACIGCHGAALSGGKIPGTPPDWPAGREPDAGTRRCDGTLSDRRGLRGHAAHRQAPGRQRRQHRDAVRRAAGDERHRRAGDVPAPEAPAGGADRRKALSRRVAASTGDAPCPRVRTRPAARTPADARAPPRGRDPAIAQSAGR